MTPEGIIEIKPNDFGNSWKTEDSCLSSVNEEPIPDPCANDPGRKELINNKCQLLKSSIFAGTFEYYVTI